MPLQTTEFVLDEEIDRLEEERAELVEQVADIAPDNPAVEELGKRGQTIDSYLQGLRWAREEWDVDSITLGGLTGGEFGQVEDKVNAARERNGQRHNSGVTRVYYVAAGTVDAPYIDDDMDEDDRTAAVSQLPITYLRWAEAQIEELTSVGGNGQKSFGELVAEKRRTASDGT